MKMSLILFVWWWSGPLRHEFALLVAR
jgi:hypothetical protein